MPILLKSSFLIIYCLVILSACTSQPTFNYYSANKNADLQLLQAITKAKEANKPILVQIGGNWCPWTYRLDFLNNQNNKLKTLINTRFIFVPINHSLENSNIEFIHRFDKNVTAIPHWFILNSQGMLFSSTALTMFETYNSFQPADLIQVLQKALKEI